MQLLDKQLEELRDEMRICARERTDACSKGVRAKLASAYALALELAAKRRRANNFRDAGLALSLCVSLVEWLFSVLAARHRGSRNAA
jgi:hypothetical protein